MTMQKTISGFTLWFGWGPLTRLAELRMPGQLRYALKKSMRALEPHWKDILDFIKEDREEFGWEAQPNGTPQHPNDFYNRLDALLAKEFTVDIHAFDEELLASVDGLSVTDEKHISFLFFEPKEVVEA